MKASTACLLLSAWLGCSAAEAHAHLVTSTPAEGAVLPAPPQAVALTFSEGAQFTLVSLQKGADPKQSITPLPPAAANTATVPMPALTPGSYTLSWRVLSNDGHVASGTLHFSVAAPSERARPVER